MLYQIPLGEVKVDLDDFQITYGKTSYKQNLKNILSSRKILQIFLNLIQDIKNYVLPYILTFLE